MHIITLKNQPVAPACPVSPRRSRLSGVECFRLLYLQRGPHLFSLLGLLPLLFLLINTSDVTNILQVTQNKGLTLVYTTPLPAPATTTTIPPKPPPAVPPEGLCFDSSYYPRRP